MDKKTRPIYMLSTRDPPQNKRPTQAESEGMKKYFMKMDIKGEINSNTVIVGDF